MTYLFGEDAPARLEALEDFLDEGTTRALERLGIASDWRCLEVGAGGGSVARWLAERATVVATDIDTR
jgi:2-polyprenyl-3-methyl-5-hydroxy-6-metoxy-1,4-benzoquinol methylase